VALQLERKQVIGIIWLSILALILFPFVFRGSLSVLNRVIGAPDLEILEDYQPIGSIEIYDYEGNFVGVLQGKEDRQVVKLNQISDYLKQSLLAAEDNDFYHHSGFSLSGFFRALTKNIMAGRVVQGGSTLTQQMVKNLFINEDDRYKRTITRKIRELLIAIEVEDKYDKDKILEIYLNQVYFGNRAYGIERAAQRYFSKPASKLNLVESSYMAALLTAPSYLSTHLDKAKERQKYVLERMLKHGYISEEEYKEAQKTELVFNKSAGNLSKFPYYFSLVENELRQRFTPTEMRNMGLKIYTGMDPVAQRLAKQALNTGVKNAPNGINQGALVSIDVESGEVRALIGGVGNFWEFQYNRATNPHTLGSGIKPFVYLTAFRRGTVDPNSIIKDEKLVLKDISAEDGTWIPKNFDHEYHGPITVRAALTFSRNIPAIKIAMKTGIRHIMETARLAGIQSPMQPLLSLALGAQAFTPLEVATAYSTLARGGVHMDAILIKKITDSKGRVLEINRAVPKTALPERYVAQVVDIMKDVVRYGTGALANIPGRIIAGKTGTADGSRDIWFTGFMPELVTTVWAGNENNKEVMSKYATGGGSPAWIWREYNRNYLKEKPRPVRNFSFSQDHITVMIDPLTNLLATEYTPNPVAKRFRPGTEPTRYAPIPETEDIKKSRALNKKRKQVSKTGKKKLSEEDEKLRLIRERRSEARKQAKRKRNKRIQIIPQPKSFKISDENKRKTEEQESE